METSEIKDEKLIRALDLLEQIQDLNQMIELHQSEHDQFMLHQYEYRKGKLVKELSEILKALKITPEDLAA